MAESMDEAYLEWLYRQIGSVKQRNPTQTYWSLSRQMFETDFVWFVPNDDNRVEDGKDLRYEFIEVSGLEEPPPDHWRSCSFFELVLGLSRRLAFETDTSERQWTWHLLENLDLRKFNDRFYDNNPESYEEIDAILNRVIWRTYNADGSGGFFPLSDPSNDQRDVELWYQMGAYILENHL